MAKNKNSIRACLAAALLVLVAMPVMAQEDFSGEWEARYHEDQPERIPGPSLGDYLGASDQRRRPDARRLVGRVAPDAARMAVPSSPG